MLPVTATATNSVPAYSLTMNSRLVGLKVRSIFSKKISETVIYYLLSINSTTIIIPTLLADPGKARGCFTKSNIVH